MCGDLNIPDELLIEMSTESDHEQEETSTDSMSIEIDECNICENDLISLQDLEEGNYHNVELYKGRKAIICNQCLETIILYLSNLK